MKKENWKPGKTGRCVVTDNPEGLSEGGGFSGIEAVKYYGGNLVCESVCRKKDVNLIAAAPDMLEALQNLENDDNSIPEHAWNLVKYAIEKATGVNDI